MALTVDEVKVLIDAEIKPYLKKMDAVKDKTNGVREAIKSLKGFLAGLALGAAIFQIGKQSTQMALEVSASLNQIKRIMGESTQSFLKWANNSAIAYNMARADAIKYGAVYSNLFSNFIKDSDQLAGYTVKMLQASSVVASATGRSMDDVMNRIRSGMLGSTEAIEDLGINVNVAMIKSTNAFQQFANGQSWEQLDFNTQQAIRMMAILEQASAKYGDTIMQGPVSSLAYFVALLKDSALNIGNALLPVIQAVMPILNGFAMALRTVTGHLATFMQLLFGKTAEASGGVSQMASDVSGMSKGLDNAGTGAGKLADGVGKAGKAAKQAKKELLGLMGFDEINILNKNNDTSDSNSGGAGGSGGGKRGSGGVGGGIQLPKVSFNDAFSNEDNGPILAFLEKFKALIQPTVEALGRLKEALDRVGFFAWQNLQNFYEYFLKPVGAWVLGEGLPRFIDIISTTLNNIDFPKINDALADLYKALAPFTINIGEGLLWFLENVLSPLTSWTVSEIVPLFIKGLTSVIETLTAVMEGWKPYKQWLFDNLLVPLASWTGGVVKSVLEGIVSVLESFSKWCQSNKSTVGAITTTVGLFFAAWKVSELLAFIGQAGGLMTILTRLKDFIYLLTVAKLKDKIETIQLTLMYAGETVAKWASVAATTAMTAATWLLNAAIAVLTSPITLVVAAIAGLIAIGYLLVTNWDTVKAVAGAVWQWICEFIGGICSSIGDFFTGLWDGIVKTFQDVGKWFADMFKAAWDNITNIFKVAGQWFGDIWQSITNVFSGVSSFFSGIFKGAWDTITGIFSSIPNWFSNIFSQAWAGVRDVFSTGGRIFAGIVDGIAGTFRSVVNAIIGGINGVIAMPFNAINGALDGIRGVNILGFSPFTWLPRIGVPRIPMLARGGIVDNATLAIVGEAGKEAVMPLENNTGWITELARKLSDRMPNVYPSQPSYPTEIVIKIGDNNVVLGRALIKAINYTQEQAGQLLLNI